MEEGKKVRIHRTPDGDYILSKEREDGSVVLRPDPTVKASTSVRGAIPTPRPPRSGSASEPKPVSDEEFERRFGHLLTDARASDGG